jgi:hypothetical protein
MRLFFRSKDGGAESSVTGYWLIEAKGLFSIVLLRFDGLSREAFHTHAFDCLSWVVKGALQEVILGGPSLLRWASWLPFITRRSTFHKVHSIVPRTWVLSIRGPWTARWEEYLPMTNEFVTLSTGREVVSRRPA